MQLDHLGIAVENLDAALRAYGPLASGAASTPEVVGGQDVRVSFLPLGATHLEFLEPTKPDSPVGRFLARRGPGLHHVAFAVPNVDAALASIRERGGRLIDDRSRPGARGRRVGFAHPSAFLGSLVEFVEGP
ncbi:MAG: VOC family protein [Thermoplasmata archaeon]|nr:VOC family protein [Thermoplasmata archaeon]